MARIPAVTRDKVPAKHQKAFDQVISNRNRGAVVDSGPGSIMINSPEMALRANQLSSYLRNDSALPKKVQELAMLTAARGMDCQYIWNAHAASARQAGASDALVDALRDKKPLPAMSPDEAGVVLYGLEFFKTHRVSQATFDAALNHFGPQGLAELTTLMGYYALLAFNANAFQIDLPSQKTEKTLPI